MDLCVIKRGDKYLAYDGSEYKWVSRMGSAYLYFGSARVVMDFHTLVMSRCEGYAYVEFINQGKGNIQTIPVKLEEVGA